MPQRSFTAYLYKPELKFLKWLVLQKRQIETGGDLFGCWQDESTAVVQLILGPGKGCRRTTVSFHQDVSYLGKVGDYLTSSQGLCNIGEWHSHHTLGLAEPSAGDQRTVWNHLPSVAGGRFLVFIANIRGTSAEPKVNIGCFLFNLSEQKMHRGEIKEISFPSPVRLSVDDAKISSGAEYGQEWKTFNEREQTASNVGDESSDSESSMLLKDAESRGTWKRFCTKKFLGLLIAVFIFFIVVAVVVVVVRTSKETSSRYDGNATTTSINTSY